MLIEKSAFLKGFIEGLKLDPEKDETKILSSIVTLLCETSKKLEAAENRLQELEKLFYEEQVCTCAHNERLPKEAPCYENQHFQIVCPSCGEMITVDDEMLQDETVLCPNCGQNLELDIEEDDDKADC